MTEAAIHCDKSGERDIVVSFIGDWRLQNQRPDYSGVVDKVEAYWPSSVPQSPTDWLIILTTVSQYLTNNTNTSTSG